jgi:hypothetical protein
MIVEASANVAPVRPLDCPMTDHSVGLDLNDRREFVLSLVRVARARMQVAIQDLDHIGLAFKCGVIHPAQAVAMLREMGVDEFPYPPDVTLEAAA